MRIRFNPEDRENQEKESEEVQEVSYEKRLTEIIPEYQKFDTLQKVNKNNADVLKDEIKGIMVENDLKDFSVNGTKVSVSVAQKQTFNEEVLLQICEKLEIEGLVKTKPYVDLDVLGSAIYNKQVDPKILAKAQIMQEVVSLRVSKEKKSCPM